MHHDITNLIIFKRVRNPWGDKNEWRGEWSDGDSCWDSVSDEVKREMGLHYMHDGEFWIEFFTDFCREFEVSVRDTPIMQHLHVLDLLDAGSQYLYPGT